jgi:hypothetical protein
MSPGDACLRPEELGELEGCPPEDPRRRHLEECPRCRALWIAYRGFMETPDPRTPGACAAEERLAEQLRAEIYGTASTPGSSTEPPEGETAHGFLRILLGRPLVPALAAAGLILLAVWGIQELREAGPGPGDGILLRETQTAGAPVVRGLVARRRADGGLALRWQTVAGADRYEVTFYGSGLAEVARLDAGRDSTLTLTPERLHSLRDRSRALFWRVTAYRMGDPVGDSELEVLDDPSEP